MASRDVETLMSEGFCGFMSILSAMKYCIGDQEDLSKLWLAFFFMPFGLFFDLFDGKVARWRKKSSLMGQELDSLADLVCKKPEGNKEMLGTNTDTYRYHLE